MAWGHSNLGKPVNQVQTAHTSVPFGLEPTAQARFSSMSITGEQDKSSELRDRISGPGEAVQEEGCLEILQRGGSYPR